jgi:hypothetical protein
MYADPGFDPTCPDCLAEIHELQAKRPPPDRYAGCGLSSEGHRQMREVRKQAEEDASKLILEQRKKAVYERVLEKAFQDELDRRTTIARE